jgi:hypothetical protein
LEVTVPEATLNDALLAPLGMFTVAGVVRTALSSERATLAPFAAILFRVTVQLAF